MIYGMMESAGILAVVLNLKECGKPRKQYRSLGGWLDGRLVLHSYILAYCRLLL
jgi:hypothetical protein